MTCVYTVAGVTRQARLPARCAADRLSGALRYTLRPYHTEFLNQHIFPWVFGVSPLAG
jgi:hypothetical protein